MDLTKLRTYNYLIGEIEGVYHDTAARMGISDSVLSILYAAWEQGGRCLQSEIYRQTGTSRQTINSALRKLREKGLVRLEPGQGRSTVVCLTEEGTRLAERTARPIMEAENEIFGEWSPEELDVYLRLTERYRDALQSKLKNLPRRGGEE